MENKVLVIDDDIGTCRVLSELFMMKNILATVVHTGRDALAVLKQENNFDIALIDIHLPDIEGTEILTECRKKYPTLDCIIITGDVSIQIAVDSLQRGAIGYFVKPLILNDVSKRIEDIIEKKRLRHEVEMLNALPRLILDSINESISIIDVNDFSIVSVNRAFLKEIGLREEDVIGKTCYSITHHFSGPCDREGHACPVQETIESGDYVTVEHEHINSDGETRYCEVSSSPVKDESGKVMRIVHLSRDITERKKLEESLVREKKLEESAHADLAQAYVELQQTQARIIQQEKLATIGQLAAGVAHEINNPMGFITSNLSTLNKYVNKIKKYIAVQDEIIKKHGIQDENLANIQKELKFEFIYSDIGDLIAESLDGAARVKEIVQNLKSFSRVDENEFVSADINECIENTLNIVWNEIKYKATVNKEFADLPMVMCYPQQLNQVFMNLLMNASQAIENQGEISIKTWQENGFVNVAVSDTGSGIPKENLKKIFEPFFTTKEAGKGTGLGMSIALDIVKKHDGDILVDSEAGKGTTFTVKVPMK